MRCIQEAERMLIAYNTSNEEIHRLNDELNKTYQMKYDTQNTLKAAILNSIPHGYDIQDATYGAVERSIDRHDEHIQFLVLQIQRIYDEKELIHKAIQRLTVEEFRAIDLKYFKSYKVGKVAGIMHYTRQYCYEIIRNALSKIAWCIETSDNCLH